MSDMSDTSDKGDDGPTNDALLEALTALDDEAAGPARGRMFAALLDAQLIVPVTDEQGIREDEGDLDLDVPILTTADGRTAMSVFSDEEALTRFEPDGTPYVVIEGRTLFRLLAADPPGLMVLNAAGPIGLELEEDELAALARGQVPPSDTAPDAPEGAQLQIGVPDPDDIPVGLVPAARDALAADADLVEGYLLTVASQDGEESQIALGIAFGGETDEEAIRATFQTVAEQIRDHVGDGGIGMFPLGETLLEQLRGSVEPLYEAG